MMPVATHAGSDTNPGLSDLRGFPGTISPRGKPAKRWQEVRREDVTPSQRVRAH